MAGAAAVKAINAAAARAMRPKISNLGHWPMGYCFCAGTRLWQILIARGSLGGDDRTSGGDFNPKDGKKETCSPDIARCSGLGLGAAVKPSHLQIVGKEHRAENLEVREF